MGLAVLSLIGAIRVDKVLTHRIFEGSVNGPRFVEFVERQLCPRLYPGDVVVLDNLRAHYAPPARELVEAAGARLVFLAPCPPEFNPIEPCWSFIKNRLRRQKERTVEPLKRAIRNVFARVRADC